MSILPHPTSPNDSNISLGLERIVFFSDAVMAIAITLLAIDLKVPEISASLAAAQLPIQLEEMVPRLGSFFISFVVIGVYWNAHHRYFGYIKRYDSILIFLNMVFLLFIVLMPFVAGLLGMYAYLPLGVILYSLAVSLIGFSLASMWFYATYKHRLVDEALDPSLIRFRLGVALFGPLVFLISIPFAWISPSTTMSVWWISSLALFGIRRLVQHRKPAQKTPTPGEHEQEPKIENEDQGE